MGGRAYHWFVPVAAGLLADCHHHSALNPGDGKERWLLLWRAVFSSGHCPTELCPATEFFDVLVNGLGMRQRAYPL